MGPLFGQGGGCARSGCGLLSLLMLAGMLMGLFKTCTQSTPTPAPIVIHDTVYVEKIRERIDTVKLLQRDTIRMVDSTRLINYETLTLPNVNFFTKSAKLTPSSIPDIQQVAEYLISHEGLEAVVIGHTDSLGDSKENLRLSAERAEVVRNMIVMMGVEEKRITAIGKGDSEPKADNSTEEGRLMNRRVELQLRSNQVIENKRIVIPPQP
jgi:outer membrane protein OmpA-like peptidoglycan-associated protein